MKNKNGKLKYMGLHVSVYKNIKLTEYIDYDFIAYVTHSDWQYKIKNLENREAYKGELCNCSVSYSYSQHSRFREILVKIINRNDLLLKNGEIDWDKMKYETTIPFYDLIWFSDCEGCIDWETSNKLYNYFLQWQPEAIKHLKDDNFNYSYYTDWTDVFKTARHSNRVVVFG